MMVSMEWVIELIAGILPTYIFYKILDNIYIAFIIGFLSFSVTILYFSAKEQGDITSTSQNISNQIYTSDNIPHTLLQDCNPIFYAYSGFLFLSTIEDDTSVATIRLENQFNVFHVNSQLGAMYILPYKVEIGKSWSNTPDVKKKHILQQIKLHIENFHRVLHEMIPGTKLRFLTINELQKELGLSCIHPIPVDFESLQDFDIPQTSETLLSPPQGLLEPIILK